MIGQTLSHYKIVDKLGAGGMGEVYRAQDTTLDREVALKVLPAELAESQERLDRFQREAKTLAALDHPNIVTIYSVESSVIQLSATSPQPPAGREGDALKPYSPKALQPSTVHFLTMQLVEGKPLSELIPPGGMPLHQIFKIAVPLADALATAHDKGIIHRDLKPANVMVTDAGRVKVLDFGLAKLRQDSAAPLAGAREGASPSPTQVRTDLLTEEGRILGTMPYMSPEQLEGKELDGRSDVFSFGVVLYEMATGHRPFKGDTSASLIMSIGRDIPPDVDTVRGELPHHLGRVIARCLEKDPEQRFQTIKDVRNEFQTLKRETDSREVPASEVAVPLREPSRQSWWPVVVAVGLVLAALGIWLVLRDRTPEAERSVEGATEEIEASASPKRKMIVVLPFENLGSPEDDYFAAGMTEEITSRLAMVSGMGVISRNRAVRYADTDKTIQEIGAELGVDYVLEGTVRWAKDGAGSRVRITPQLIQVVDDTHLWADAYDRVIEDIFALQSEIAESVITELGIKLADTERESLAMKPTDNPAAYQAYLQGLEIHNLPIGTGRFPVAQTLRAAEMFERAVTLDPSFAPAWAWLSRMKALEHFNGGTDPELVPGAKAALDRAIELAPENPYVRLASGYYHYYGLRDFDRALQEFEAVATGRPNNVEAIEAIGFILRRQGRFGESAAAHERTLVLDPRSVTKLLDLTFTYRAQRRFDEVFRSLDRAIALAPNSAALYAWKASFMIESGRLDAAREVLSQAPVTDPMHRRWFFLEFLDRNFEAALEHAELRPREEPMDRVWTDLSRGAALSRLDRTEEARAVLQEAAKEAETLVDSGSAYAGDALGLIYARLGRKEDAIRVAQRQMELWANDLFEGPRAEYILAYIYALAGDAEPAVEIFDRLLATSYAGAIMIEMLRLDPNLDPIRDHPRFQAMLEKYGQRAS